MSTTFLPTGLVARLRAVDREFVGSKLVDTPAHLDQLTEDIGRYGIPTPLRLGWNERLATLDGNHRIAVALRLGLDEVPVELHRLPLEPRPLHARVLSAVDLATIAGALASAHSAISSTTASHPTPDEIPSFWTG